MGPLEFLAIGFPGNHFTGAILPALPRVAEQGTIRVVDLTFIRKDAAGRVTSDELTELPEPEAALLDPLVRQITGLLSPADVKRVGGTLDPESSAALLLLEHLWATELQQAILDANGVLVVREFIPPSQVKAATATADAPNPAG
jgi:hypothetical protein